MPCGSPSDWSVSATTRGFADELRGGIGSVSEASLGRSPANGGIAVADVINKATMEIRRSVSTPDYPPATWKVNPDLSAVNGQPTRHWVWNALADRPELMTAPERAAVDAARLSAEADAEAARGTGKTLEAAIVGVMLDELNTLRAQAGLPTRTMTQLRNAIRAKLS